MDQRQLFETGVRLVGLYFLVRALPYFVGTIIHTVVLLGTTGQVFVRAKLYDTLSLVSDGLLIVIGLCLLKGFRFVRRIAFQEQQNVSTSPMKEFFTVGVKLVGILLAVGTIPRLVLPLSYFFYIVTSDQYSAASGEMGGRSYFVPQLAAILFGILLYLRGELLSAWAIPTGKDMENPDPDPTE